MVGPAGRRWTVAQIGHREEYAAARAFVPHGRLAGLYTDNWCRYGASVLQRGPAPLRRLALRSHPDLLDQRVVAWTAGCALHRLVDIVKYRQSAECFDYYLRKGEWFDDRLVSQLHKRPLDAEGDAFFTFNTGSLRALRRLRGQGVPALIDQVHPARVEHDMEKEEAARWPGWETAPLDVPEAFYERLQAEWEAASGVIVNSEWSADALVRQGVPRHRISVVPLAYEPRAMTGRTNRRPTSGLTVLWLGAVCLRKGIQYLMEAARLLADRSIRFVVIGPVLISEKALATAPSSMEFRPEITHDRVSQAYAAADVFVLPTLSDGFGRTQLEAMSNGLPVVATPNCGTVVDHGYDGLSVPSRDPDALARALALLDDDRDLLEQMSERAPAKASQFSLERYREALDHAADEAHLRFVKS